MRFPLFNRSPSFLDRLPSAAALIFIDGMLAYITPNLAQRLGFGSVEYIKASYTDLLPARDRQTIQRTQQQSGHSAHFLRLTLKGKKGASVAVNVCVEGFTDGLEHTLGLWGVIVPNEADQLNEVELREYNAQSISFDEGYGATFSHEVRNPLSALIGLVGLLQETELSEEQNKLVGSISSVADHLIMLLNDMIDSSRFHMGKIVVKHKPFELKPVVTTIFNRYELLSPHLHFTFEYDPSLPDVVLGDSHRLSQILTNLLSNAVKFTPQGSVSLRVKNMHNSRDIVFEVQDTGAGMSRDTLDRLFFPFERGKEVGSQAGSGLGLYISKQLVEMHHGTIQAFSRINEGSTIQATLPLISADLIGTYSPPRRDDSAEGHPAAHERAAGGDRRILIVDDNKINVLVVGKFFDKWGIPNDAAYSGEEALRRLDATDYTLIFMDLRMPGMDGFETTTRIRTRRDDKGHTPIIALTASTEMGVKERIEAAGMNGYIFKPFKTEQLREVVDRYVTPQAQPPACAPEE